MMYTNMSLGEIMDNDLALIAGGDKDDSNYGREHHAHLYKKLDNVDVYNDGSHTSTTRSVIMAVTTAQGQPVYLVQSSKDNTLKWIQSDDIERPAAV